jgi:hypothetical protein
MALRHQLFHLLLALLPLVSTWDVNNANDRHGCQSISSNPLDGCDPERTLFVDFVSSHSNFKTVQSGKNLQHLISLLR